jgi:hypothetical protein
VLPAAAHQLAAAAVVLLLLLLLLRLRALAVPAAVCLQRHTALQRFYY